MAAAISSAAAASTRTHGRAFGSNTSGRARMQLATWMQRLGSQWTTIPAPSYLRRTSGLCRASASISGLLWAPPSEHDVSILWVPPDVCRYIGTYRHDVQCV